MYAHQSEVLTPVARIAPPPAANRLLAKLTSAEYQRLAPHLEPVALPIETTIHEAGEQLKYAYFPIDGALAGLNTLSDGSTTHISITGNEGMVGISLYMGGQHNPSRAVVELAGTPTDCRRRSCWRNSSAAGHFNTCCCAMPRH